jgi:hypothetical protein
MRGMGHYSPRDKESNDGSRRWRDDGKHEGRLTARRERDRDAHERDRALYDNERDTPDDKARDRDRDRWHTTDERGSRLKRPWAKDRRSRRGKGEASSNPFSILILSWNFNIRLCRTFLGRFVLATSPLLIDRKGSLM